jgi:hypothetical protein
MTGAAEMDADTLAAQCASGDWRLYMPCQLMLLEVSRNGAYCIPEGTSAARFQIEFPTFYAGSDAAPGMPAAHVAAAYFEARFGCR